MIDVKAKGYTVFWNHDTPGLWCLSAVIVNRGQKDSKSRISMTIELTSNSKFIASSPGSYLFSMLYTDKWDDPGIKSYVTDTTPCMPIAKGLSIRQEGMQRPHVDGEILHVTKNNTSAHARNMSVRTENG